MAEAPNTAPKRQTQGQSAKRSTTPTNHSATAPNTRPKRQTQGHRPYRENSLGRVTMCPFWDNILVASSYPDCAHTKLIRNICYFLRKAWNLSVLCECRSANLPGEGSCHTSCVTAMGFCMVRGPHGMGLAYIHPNALGPSWDLKQAPPPPPPEKPPDTTPGVCHGHLYRGPRCRGTVVYHMGGAAPHCQCMVSGGIFSGYEHKRVSRWAHSAI